MKFVLLVSAMLACASCTTLENRRDLYRSPAEGYERWYRHPPPTRLPSTGPVTRGVTTESHGVIRFREEASLPDAGR
ncbi:MAG: hypothetical protein H0T95_05655 [Chthoniobacterales bacterium]|nr:hypothetical protein [Chthoniobacterales bacterium]MBA3762980.1 hypothetical protein [Chthoniobacterales bacterium]